MSALRSGEDEERECAPETGTEGETTPAGESIPALRERINEADSELLSLLARRRELSSRVAQSKASGPSPVRDQQREEELLGRLIRAGRELGLDAHFVTSIFHEIIEDSLRIQHEYLQRLANLEDRDRDGIRIAFQGIEGAYSHLAAENFFSRETARLAFDGYNEFEEVVQAVEEGRADYAMLPVENTTSGSINEVYDLLLHTRLSLVGEEKFHVRHCLVGTGDVPLDEIRRVYSHPQAVAQCRKFLSTLKNCKVETFTDTAMSVARIKDEQERTHAAIASEQAARLYGLHILRRNIANQASNYTRFLVAARNAREVDLRLPCKTSIVMATGQTSGSLVDALLVLKQHGINLTKLESRPILGNPWEEMFYLDFEGNIADERVAAAIREVTKKTRFIKVLGSYPSRDLPPTAPPVKALAAAADPPRGLASREHKAEGTVVEIRGLLIGNGSFVVLAGPEAILAVETIRDYARLVKEKAGAVLTLSDLFRPGFEKGDESGQIVLSALAEAGRNFGLPTAAEVSNPRSVELTARHVDMLLVAAGHMHNEALLREVGRMPRAVVLSREPASSMDDLLAASELVLSQGNQQVILCEEGVRTLDSPRRRTLDLAAIPALKARSHLPVIVRPDRVSATAEQVLPLAAAARAVGADGVWVSLRDGEARESALSSEAFADFMAKLLS